MRSENEVRKMFGKAVNATPFMPERGLKQRMKKDVLYAMIQVLNWVLDGDADAPMSTKKLEQRIENLKTGKE